VPLDNEGNETGGQWWWLLVGQHEGGDPNANQFAQPEFRQSTGPYYEQPNVSVAAPEPVPVEPAPSVPAPAPAPPPAPVDRSIGIQTPGPYPLERLPPPVILQPIADEVPGIILTPPDLPPGELEQGAPVPLDELEIPTGGFQLRRESKEPDAPDGYPILYDANGNRIGRVIPGHFTTNIVEGERGFDRVMIPDEETDFERLLRGGVRPRDPALDPDFERLMRGTRTNPDFERLMKMPRLPMPERLPFPSGVPLPGAILGDIFGIIRDRELRERQEREAVRPGPGGYRPPVPQPQPERAARGAPPRPDMPPLPPGMPPPSVPREPPQPVAKRDTAPPPLPQPVPAPIPRLPAPIPRMPRLDWPQIGVNIARFFFRRNDPWPTHLSDFGPLPLTSAPPSTMPEPFPLVPSTVPQPSPAPQPFVPSLPEPPTSSQTSPAPSPLTAFNPGPLRFASSTDCDCRETDNPPLPSDTIADMKPFKRRMSQYSLNNLKRGTKR